MPKQAGKMRDADAARSPERNGEKECPGQDSNLHDTRPDDFKSSASTIPPPGPSKPATSLYWHRHLASLYHSDFQIEP